MIEMLNTDCMKYMATVPDNYFDMGIVDPPYGIGDFLRHTAHKKHIDRKYGNSVEWNNNVPAAEYFHELKRVSREQIIWGANYFNCFRPEGGGALVWYKNVGTSTISQAEIASLSFQKKVDVVQINLLSGCVENDSGRIHPCQKPVELYKFCLERYARPGFKIFDTHMGSASSAIACHHMGFDFVGCEIDKGYFKDSQKRFEIETSQISLI